MSKETKQTTEEISAAPETQTGAESPVAELTIQDLQALKAIIDVASQRGAFKPNEMMTVGQVYTKLESFLDSVVQQQQVQQPKEN
jgi:hypothetical protein